MVTSLYRSPQFLRWLRASAIARWCWLGICGAALFLACSSQPRNWVAYYGTDLPPHELRGFDVVVVDPEYRGAIAPLQADGAKVLAYLSLGEINASRPQFANAKSAGVLLQENPNWPGAWMVDIRKPEWHAIAEDMAAALLAQGFDGLFLDTVDSPLHLEATDPKQFAGMKTAAAQLLGRLHARFPSARLLLNGATELAGPCKGQVDWIAIESSLTDWDFAAKQARWRRPDERAWALNRMRQAKADNPQLVLFTLDYWDAADSLGIARIYREQRAAGFVPYAATIALDRVVREPGVATPSGRD